MDVASTLSDRLRGIVGGTVPRVAPEVGFGTGGGPAERAATRAREARKASAGPGSADRAAAAVLGGTVAERPEGPVVVVERRYAAADRHGRTAIAEIADTLLGAREAMEVLLRSWPFDSPSARHSRAGGSLRASPALTPELLTSDLRPPASGALWFLDLETTGLAGGAGTQAFLVGCASIDDDGVQVRQFLLPGYEHERALLAEVAAWSAARGAVVTFNGKSFDLPLIETRYLFHRVAFPMEGLPHVDMLHPARRLWRARATVAGGADASCTLATLERLLSGVHRVGDVPAFEIPSRYFQFVRDGDARPLAAVLEHNRLDLLSLALVMARTLTLIDRGPDRTRDAYECLGLARIYDRAGLPDEADAAYVRAIERLDRVGRDPEACGDALRRLAWCRRRAGRRREAAEAWQRLVDLPRCPARFREEAREALAIHHEHRSRDLSTARALVLDLLDEARANRTREAAQYRLRRLDRKLASSGSGLF
jgi:hypothetical protein